MWTAAELKKVIAMLHNPEFDTKDIDPDLNQQMAKAVDDGRIKCFNLREGAADGDQDLNLWIRDVEDVMREIMEILSSKAITTSILKWNLTS